MKIYITRAHPSGRIIKDVAVHYQKNDCLLPILKAIDGDDLEFDHEFVYCSYCNSFIKIKSNLSNLEKHYKTAKHGTVISGDTQYTQRMINTEVATSLKKALLFHHLPISFVDSKYLAEVVTLPCRQTFTKNIKDYAAKTRQRIKGFNANANNFTITFDVFQRIQKKVCWCRSEFSLLQRFHSCYTGT